MNARCICAAVVAFITLLGMVFLLGRVVFLVYHATQPEQTGLARPVQLRQLAYDLSPIAGRKELLKELLLTLTVIMLVTPIPILILREITEANRMTGARNGQDPALSAGCGGRASKEDGTPSATGAAAETTAARTREAAATSRPRPAVARDLQAIATSINLLETNNRSRKIDMLEQAHVRWVDHLKDMVGSNGAPHGGRVGSQTSFVLTRWHYARDLIDSDSLLRGSGIKTRDTRIDEEISRVIETHSRGDYGTAEAGCHRVACLCQEIVSSLDGLRGDMAHRG